MLIAGSSDFFDTDSLTDALVSLRLYKLKKNVEESTMITSPVVETCSVVIDGVSYSATDDQFIIPAGAAFNKDTSIMCPEYLPYRYTFPPIDPNTMTAVANLVKASQGVDPSVAYASLFFTGGSTYKLSMVGTCDDYSGAVSCILQSLHCPKVSQLVIAGSHLRVLGCGRLPMQERCPGVQVEFLQRSQRPIICSLSCETH